MHTFHEIWRGLDWSYLIELALSVLPALLCITLHECAHGWAAHRLGDDTAKRMGRLTLNPLKHIDLIGLAMMVLFHFGWAKPVPVEMRKFKNPKRDMAITAAAGPLMNLLICAAAMFLYGLVLPLAFFKESAAIAYLSQGLYLTSYLSLALALFNIIPIPPLDGSKVLYSLLPDRSYMRLMRYERYGMIALLALIIIGSWTDLDPLGRATGWVFDRLYVFMSLGADCGKALVLGMLG